GRARAELLVRLVVLRDAGLEQELVRLSARPADLRNPAAAVGIARRFRRRKRVRIEAVVILAVELLLDVRADLLLAANADRPASNVAVVALAVAVGLAAIGELRARDVDFVVLVFVGEEEPGFVLDDGSAERRVRLPIERRAGNRDERQPVG